MSQIVANRLAVICAYSSDAPEWEQLVRVITPVVALSARRVSAIWGDRSGTTVSEIVQNVFLKLCEDDRRILREFEDRGDDSFLRLVRVVTATVATDHFRRSHADKRGGQGFSGMSIPQERSIRNLADAKATEAVQWPTLIAQLDGLLRLYPGTVSARDRNLFWLHYRHGMSTEAISRIPSIGLSGKGVESALKRLRRLLRKKVAAGRPIVRIPQKGPENMSKSKGISPAIAINSVKDR